MNELTSETRQGLLADETVFTTEELPVDKIYCGCYFRVILERGAYRGTVTDVTIKSTDASEYGYHTAITGQHYQVLFDQENGEETFRLSFVVVDDLCFAITFARLVNDGDSKWGDSQQSVVGFEVLSEPLR